MKAATIIEGRVYWPKRMGRDGFRRVLGFVTGHVVYSTGGDRNYRCSPATFRRWMKREGA
ncbi:MAG: hypothetical protein ACE15D_18890 [Candidatus Eisenbacteria bacterium]